MDEYVFVMMTRSKNTCKRVDNANRVDEDLLVDDEHINQQESHCKQPEEELKTDEESKKTINDTRMWSMCYL